MYVCLLAWLCQSSYDFLLPFSALLSICRSSPCAWQGRAWWSGSASLKKRPLKGFIWNSMPQNSYTYIHIYIYTYILDYLYLYLYLFIIYIYIPTVDHDFPQKSQFWGNTPAMFQTPRSRADLRSRRRKGARSLWLGGLGGLGGLWMKLHQQRPPALGTVGPVDLICCSWFEVLLIWLISSLRLHGLYWIMGLSWSIQHLASIQHHPALHVASETSRRNFYRPHNYHKFMVSPQRNVNFDAKKWVSELEGLTFAATRPQCFLFSKKLQVESRQLRDVRRSCFQNSPSHPSSSVSTSIQTKYLMQVI